MVTIHPCVQVSSKVEDSRFQCEKYVPEKSSRVEDDADFETWPSTYFVSSWNQCKKTYKRRPLLLFFKVRNALAKARNMSVKLQKDHFISCIHIYCGKNRKNIRKSKNKNHLKEVFSLRASCIFDWWCRFFSKDVSRQTIFPIYVFFLKKMLQPHSKKCFTIQGRR